MTDKERLDCLKKLASLKAEIDAVIAALGDKQRAQKLLRALKVRLNGEYRLISTHRGQARLNPVAKRCYVPAVQGAKTMIRVKFNSVPDDRWRSQLKEASEEINHWIADL